MNKGYTKIFWGVILSIFHINLDRFQILPNFIAYFIIASGIKNLSEISSIEYFNKGKRAAYIFFILNIFSIIANEIIQGTAFILIWYNLFSIIELLIFYNIILGSIKAINTYENNENYLTKFRIFIIYYVCAVVLRNTNILLNNQVLNIIVIWSLLLWHIWILYIMASLKKKDFNFKVCIDIKKQL